MTAETAYIDYIISVTLLDGSLKTVNERQSFKRQSNGVSGNTFTATIDNDNGLSWTKMQGTWNRTNNTTLTVKFYNNGTQCANGTVLVTAVTTAGPPYTLTAGSISTTDPITITTKNNGTQSINVTFVYTDPVTSAPASVSTILFMTADD